MAIWWTLTFFVTSIQSMSCQLVLIFMNSPSDRFYFEMEESNLKPSAPMGNFGRRSTSNIPGHQDRRV
jgi:hypothetical protein